MAVSILGGVVASTLISLCVVPAMYLRHGAGALAAGTLDLKPQAV
jgi:Cu/Ag efflux pump CusA